MYGSSSQVVDFPSRGLRHRPPRQCNASNFYSYSCLSGTWSGNEDSELTRAFFLEAGEFQNFTNGRKKRIITVWIEIESKTPGSLTHSATAAKTPDSSEGLSGRVLSTWAAPATDSASSRTSRPSCVDLRVDLSGKCLTADNLSEDRDVDITTSAGRSRACSTATWPVVRGCFSRACSGTPTSRDDDSVSNIMREHGRLLHAIHHCRGLFLYFRRSESAPHNAK